MKKKDLHKQIENLHLECRKWAKDYYAKRPKDHSNFDGYCEGAADAFRYVASHLNALVDADKLL